MIKNILLKHNTRNTIISNNQTTIVVWFRIYNLEFTNFNYLKLYYQNYLIQRSPTKCNYIISKLLY